MVRSFTKVFSSKALPILESISGFTVGFQTLAQNIQPSSRSQTVENVNRNKTPICTIMYYIIFSGNLVTVVELSEG
jgi:hypothetical protein